MTLPANYITLPDLYLAYRKAKAEAFFAKTQQSALAFTDFEQSLDTNLSQLLRSIRSRTAPWYEDITMIGGYYYIPKSIDLSVWDRHDSTHYRAIDPFVDWNNRFQQSGQVLVSAKYRLMMAPTVQFQILSALWILKVGHLYEAALDHDKSFGNRLRRINDWRNYRRPRYGGINEDSLGLFQPYFTGYQRWRETGLSTMRESIVNGDSVDAITMDLASFYHRVSPDFLLRKAFLEQMGVRLTREDRLFTKHFISAIWTWYRSTPDYADRPEGALPVGLSASKVIANVLLHQFDNEVSEHLAPLYYGRYVDDIFLVLKSNQDAIAGDDVISFIADKVPCISQEDNGALRVNFTYGKDSDLIFSGDKQKIFCLTSKHGLDLVDHIASQIRKQVR